MKKSFSWKRIFFIALVVLLFILFTGGGFVLGKVTTGKLNLKINPNVYQETALPEIFQNSLTRQVWSIINNEFVDKSKLDDKELFYSALRGLVGGLGDPYTDFFDPETTKDFNEQIAGQFAGIGAELSVKEGGIMTVVAPLPETPAEKAGILSGDKIFSVDGKEVTGMPLEKVVRMIRGTAGTTVTLVIVRGDEEPKDFVITRDIIEIKSVKYEFRADGLAYLQISGFNADTSELVSKFEKELKTRKPRGIILDLRNDPGGLLETALDIGSKWVEKDTLLIEKFGDGREIKYTAGNKAVFKGYPTVVLINQGSASASEIVAGALQDYKLGTLVGKKSFGKGSVQMLKSLSDGSSVKVTVAKWLTPNGRSINEEGIQPDVEVDITKEDVQNKKDPQLEKAIELLNK